MRHLNVVYCVDDRRGAAIGSVARSAKTVAEEATQGRCGTIEAANRGPREADRGVLSSFDRSLSAKRMQEEIAAEEKAEAEERAAKKAAKKAAREAKLAKRGKKKGKKKAAKEAKDGGKCMSRIGYSFYASHDNRKAR